MKNFFLILLLIFSLNSWPAIPSMEGLFRNASNPEWEGGLGVLKFQVKSSVEGKIIPHFYKFLLYKEDREKTQGPLFHALLVEYSSGQMKPDEILSKFYFEDWKKTLAEEGNVERSFLFSVFTMLILNDSEIMGQFLKKYGEGFLFNSETLNPEKRKLLETYKNYLKTTKEDKSLEDSLASPLKSDDPEVQKDLKNLLDARMYQISPAIHSTRVNGKFFWKVDLGPIRALFSNRSHHLKKLTVDVEEKSLDLICSDYIMFDGRHVFPKIFFFKILNDDLFEIRVLGMEEVKIGKKMMPERSEDYDKLIEKFSPNALVKLPETASEEEPVVRPFSFIF